MSEDKNIAKLAQLKADAENLAEKYNDLLQKGKLVDAKKVDDEMAEKINEYTATVRTIAFDKCLAAADPMLAAVTMLAYETIKAKDDLPEGASIPIRSIIDAEKTVDLLKLSKYAKQNGKTIGADQNWVYAMQKLNFALTAQKCRDLGISTAEVNDSYAMADLAREFNMGKNPASNTQLLKSLRKVIGMMLGTEFASKVNSHDVNFLTSIYAKKTRKALVVSCANHKNFCSYIAEISHRVAVGASYGVEYKKTRQNGAAPQSTDAQKSSDKPAPKSGKSAKSAPKSAEKKAA